MPTSSNDEGRRLRRRRRRRRVRGASARSRLIHRSRRVLPRSRHRPGPRTRSLTPLAIGGSSLITSQSVVGKSAIMTPRLSCSSSRVVLRGTGASLASIEREKHETQLDSKSPAILYQRSRGPFPSANDHDEVIKLIARERAASIIAFDER